MKRIVSLAVISALLIGGGLAVYHFSGARGKVVKKKILEAIDGKLGKYEVAREEIKEGIDGMDTAIRGLSRERITAQVRAEKLGDKLKEVDRALDTSKQNLAILKKHMADFKTNATYTATVGSKSYTKPDELGPVVDKYITAHESLVTQKTSLIREKEAYEKTAATLESRETEATAKLKEWKSRLRELDAKIAQVESQKKAAKALNEADKTFGESVETLEKKLAALEDDTETEVRLEAAQWKDNAEKTETLDPSKLLTDTDNRMKRLDDLLGNK